MVSEHELRSYQGAEGRLWQSRNLVLGSIIAAALLVTALVGSTMNAQPRVDLADEPGISEISASQRGSDTTFELMSRASKDLPMESWEPAFQGLSDFRVLRPGNEPKRPRDRPLRYAPSDMEGVGLCLYGQPDDRMVKAGSGTGVTEKTVGELRAGTTWPLGLVLVVPSGDRPGLTVEVVKSEL